MDPSSTEPATSTSGATTTQGEKLLLTHGIQYAVQILLEEGQITEDLAEFFSTGEKEVGIELAKLIEDTMNEMVLVEEEEVILFDEADESEQYVLSQSTQEEADCPEEENADLEYCPEEKRAKQDEVSWNIKVKAVTAAKVHPNWTWKTIQRKVTRQLRSSSQLTKWKRMVEQGGSSRNKYEMIREGTYDRFVEARDRKQHVSSRMLRQWALQIAYQFLSDTFHFTASHSWIDRFKSHYKIRQRNVTRFVSKKDTLSFEEILKSAALFQQQVTHIVSSFDPDFVINTDQTGCEYKIQPKRTDSFQGEKATEVTVASLNKMTYWYTAQYAITLSGKLVPKVFLCLQESGGEFGVRVAEDVRKQQEELGNVHVVCTKSGKLQLGTYEEFLKSVIQPYVRTNNFLLLIDSWDGQTNSVLYDEIFYDPEEGNVPTCTLKVIPPKCTPLCQPCDIYFFRQVNNFVKRLQNAKELVSANKEITNRKDIIKIHSLIHNQLSAPIFRAMIKYAWFAAKLTPPGTEKEIFCNVNQVCFPPEIALQKCACNALCFAFCAWCRQPQCFSCFYDASHGITCKISDYTDQSSNDSD